MNRNDRRGIVTRIIDDWMFHRTDDLLPHDQLMDVLKDIRRAVTITMIVAIFILARSCDGGM